MTVKIIESARINQLKTELNCPYDYRCLSSNRVWEENLTPFENIDLIQCLFDSPECKHRKHYGYTYMCNCPMMQHILEKRREDVETIIN